MSVPAPAPAPVPTAVQAPVVASIPQPVAEKLPEPQAENTISEAAHPAAAAHNGYGDDYHEDAYDDEDDVDFDLGNGPTNGTMPAQTQQEDSPGPAFHTTRGPSAKEDG